MSSDQQVKQGTSIPSQRTELRAWAYKHGHEVVTEYSDEGESARTDDRPAFQRMVADAQAKPKLFDGVLVYATDRFSRDRYDAGHYKRILRKAGVVVLSATENFEDSPEGSLMEGVVEGFAEYYSRKLGVVTRRGMREVARRGFRAGGKTPFGFTLERVQDGARDRGRLAPNDHADTVVKMFERTASGQSPRQVADWLNDAGLTTQGGRRWHSRSVDGVLRNDAYVGDTIMRGQRTENTHKPVVTRALFDHVQGILGTRRQPARKPSEYVYLVAGRARCALCGGPMGIRNISTRGKLHAYYYCSNGSRSTKCSKHHVKAQDVDLAVLDLIREAVLDPDEYARAAKGRHESSALVRETKLVLSLEAKLGNYERAIGEGATGLVTAYREAESRLADAKARLARLDAAEQLDREPTVEEVKSALTGIMERFDASDRAFLREGVMRVVREVTVNPDTRAVHAALVLPV